MPSAVNSTDEMAIEKSIRHFPIQIGGEIHSGWLPPGAAVPLPTPVKEYLLNVNIEFDGDGYLLCFMSTDGMYFGDTWHQTLNEAELAAFEWFGIARNQWEQLN